jgi:hypothetical protein
VCDVWRRTKTVNTKGAPGPAVTTFRATPSTSTSDLARHSSAPTTTDGRRRWRGHTRSGTIAPTVAFISLTLTPSPPTLPPPIPIPPGTTTTTPIPPTTPSPTLQSVSPPSMNSPHPPSCRPAYPPLFLCSLGVIFGLQALGFLIAAMVYFHRQKKRKVCLGALFLLTELNAPQAWYGQMAAHYRNGGLPPWATATVGVGDGSVKAQMLSNNSPTQGWYPKAQYENPTQFGVHGNLPTVPPTVPYSNATGVTGYTSADYHSAITIPPTPVTPSLSPQPRHSQYSSTTGSFEPYNSTPNVRHSIVYARPVSTPTQTGPPSSPSHVTPAHHGSAPSSATSFATQARLPSSPTHGAPSFYGGALVNPVIYNSPPTRPENFEASGSARVPAYYGAPHKGPEHVEASSFAQAPAYSGGPHGGLEYVEASGSAQAPAYSGDPYSANEYPKGKEYTVPPAGNPEKQ